MIQLQSGSNRLKRVRNFLLRRDYFLLPYKVLRTYSQRKELAAQVTDVPCISAGRFRALEEPGLFSSVVLDQLSDSERELIGHVSFSNYFHVDWSDNGCRITDRHPDTPYSQRQAMLATVYERIPINQRQTMSLCDLGGSNGYYSFLAERYGFRGLTVLEARPIHQQQFELIKTRMVPQSSVEFGIVDVSEGVTGTYDVVLAQGLLYHLYDHLRFMEDLYRVTNHYLVLETAMSGRFAFIDLTQLENVNEPRTGTQGISIYPSYSTVLALLRVVGFKRVSRILPPQGLKDGDGYRTGYRVMLLAEK